MEISLKGRRALVTGANSGIGAGIAAGLAAAGRAGRGQLRRRSRTAAAPSWRASARRGGEAVWPSRPTWPTPAR